MHVIYFANDQAKIDDLTAVAEDASHAVEEYIEEHNGEDDLLAEAMDGDKISKALASARLKDAKKEASDPEEVDALEHVLKLYETEAAAKKAVKEAQAALDLATLKKYGTLTEDDVKTLVLDDKWSTTVTDGVASVVTSLTFALVARIQELGDRYAETVGALDIALEKLESKITSHLADMGVTS